MYEKSGFLFVFVKINHLLWFEISCFIHSFEKCLFLFEDKLMLMFFVFVVDY